MNKLILLLCCLAFSVYSSAQEVRDTVIVTDDWRYEGQWPEGEGVRYSKKYGVYKGNFVKAEPVGPCLCVSLDRSEIYYGGIKDGKRHGSGVLSRPGGFYYQGNFENGYYEGFGRLYFPDMSVYVGAFHVGKPTYEQAKVYAFSVKKEFAAELPIIPEYKLAKKEKAFLNEALMNHTVGKKDSKNDAGKIPPKFLGQDLNVFTKWVQSLLVYPPNALSTGQVGKVKMMFTVLETGELGDPLIIESSGVPALDVEVFRVVCQSPDWTPATLDGNPRRVTYTFPIMFGFR